MEDNRFIEIRHIDRQSVPNYISWHHDQEDYLCDELVGFYQPEVDQIADISQKAFSLFELATDHMIRNDKLREIGIPKSMQKIIEYTWTRRIQKHRFMYGRFDLIGGLDGEPAKVIEFNADTCTMVPETLFWQQMQIDATPQKFKSFNRLRFDLDDQFMQLRKQFGNEAPVLLGASLGHDDDKSNMEVIVDMVSESKNYATIALNLEDVHFSDEGVFIEDGDEYVQVDILLKLFPWDWLYNEEPGLLELLSSLILKDKVTVLNPPYTAIWQNKRFLNYITQNFPNNCIAKSYDSPMRLQRYVAKSSHGRLGEEVTIMNERNQRTNHEVKTYQEMLDLPRDEEGNYYQIGMFYTHRPSALNVRCGEGPIINDDCEFYSHFIIDPDKF